jgi:hypothetical protein
MIKLGSICLMAGILYAAGGALAADGKRQVIPDFATTDKTGWVLDHTFGVDDLLPPPTGGPGPVTFDKAYPYAQQLRPEIDLSGCRSFQSDPATLDHSIDEEGE